MKFRFEVALTYKITLFPSWKRVETTYLLDVIFQKGYPSSYVKNEKVWGIPIFKSVKRSKKTSQIFKLQNRSVEPKIISSMFYMLSSEVL